MKARDLAVPAPAVAPEDPALAALGVLVAAGLPGLVVRDGERVIVVPASQVLRVALPRYVLDDPSLGRVWDEASADQLATRLQGRRVADLVAALDRDDDERDHAVDGEATLVELAAVMSQAHVPLLAVMDDGRLLGVVTAYDVIRTLMA